MKAFPLDIPDVLLIEPSVFGDDRGFFFESYNQKRFDEAAGYSVHFVQDNHSRSAHGVLRGLHYQLPPFAQGKLVRATAGEIFDVAVDLRQASPTFGKWVGAALSAENKQQLWVPPGFGHGFVVVSDYAEVQYKVDAYWSRDHERSLRWDDPTLGIEWPRTSSLLLSEKDKTAPTLAELLGNRELF